MASEKGFTLIELLVVVAIIGILAAMAIPRFSIYRDQSYCAHMSSDTKKTFISLEAYDAENEAYGTVADVNFRQTVGVTTNIDSTEPLVASSTEASNLRPKGDTYTLSQASGLGTWS